MPVAAVVAAARAQRSGPSAAAGAVCAGIGAGCIVGTAVEPVTRRPGSWSALTRFAIAANVAASAALLVTGWRHLAAARTGDPAAADRRATRTNRRATRTNR
jgi:hypothetical protein